MAKQKLVYCVYQFLFIYTEHNFIYDNKTLKANQFISKETRSRSWSLRENYFPSYSLHKGDTNNLIRFLDNNK